MTCVRLACLQPATVRVSMLNPAGHVEQADPYCCEHADELTAALIPTYFDGQPAFTTEAIA